MKRGGKLVSAVAILAVAGCGGDPRLSVRPIPTALAQGERPVPFRVAEARGQLALGNVGLALESFRKAQREDPASIDALAGLAECYDRMGRFDLARRHYEEALALAPADTRLLEALAQSLDRQGQGMEAASIRREIAQRLATASPAPAAEPLAQVPAPPVAAVAVEIPLQTAIAVERTEAIAVPALEAVSPPVRFEAPVQAAIAVAQKATSAVPALQVAVAAAAELAFEQPQPAAVEAPPEEAVALAEPARSVTIKLPAAKPPASHAMAQAAAVAQDSKKDGGPRLERLSMAEVALVTVPGARWRTEPVSHSARSATVRFVPLRPNADSAEIRLLNAARVHRLAARTRAYLRGRGWRSIAIGDADSTRARSIVLYPEGQRSVATRLSKQFGFEMEPRSDFSEVTVLLGRDSVRIAGARTGA